MKMMNLIKILLVFLLIGNTAAFGIENDLSTMPLSNDSCLAFELKKERLVELTSVIPFNVLTSRNDDAEYFLWGVGSYTFRCGGDAGYDCELFFNNKMVISSNLFREFDVVDLVPYIYQSEKTGNPYEVILVEGAQERGSSWYYVMVLKNNEQINDFFIDRGRLLISPTEEFLALHPEADEMYISFNEIISIFIDGNHQIIFRLNEKYLYPEDDSMAINQGFTCMERALNR